MNEPAAYAYFFIWANAVVLCLLFFWFGKKKLYPVLCAHYQNEKQAHQDLSASLTALHAEYNKQRHELDQTTCAITRLQSSLDRWKAAYEIQKEEQNAFYKAYSQVLQQQTQHRMEYIAQVAMQKKIMQQAYREAYQELIALYTDHTQIQKYQEDLVESIAAKGHGGHS